MFDKIAKKYKNYEFGPKSDGRSFLKVVEHLELQENAASIFNDSTCLSKCFPERSGINERRLADKKT